MADETTTAPAAPDAPTGTTTPPATDTGAGTSATHKTKAPKADPATLPGGEKFDYANASEDDFNKHFTILERKAKLDGLTASAPTPLVAVAAETAPAVAKGVPATPDPNDIRAVKDGEVRYFNRITWDAMEAKGEHAGWEETVAKPSDLN